MKINNNILFCVLTLCGCTFAMVEEGTEAPQEQVAIPDLRAREEEIRADAVLASIRAEPTPIGLLDTSRTLSMAIMYAQMNSDNRFTVTSRKLFGSYEGGIHNYLPEIDRLKPSYEFTRDELRALLQGEEVNELSLYKGLYFERDMVTRMKRVRIDYGARSKIIDLPSELPVLAIWREILNQCTGYPKYMQMGRQTFIAGKFGQSTYDIYAVPDTINVGSISLIELTVRRGVGGDEIGRIQMPNVETKEGFHRELHVQLSSEGIPWGYTESIVVQAVDYNGKPLRIPNHGGVDRLALLPHVIHLTGPELWIVDR